MENISVVNLNGEGKLSSEVSITTGKQKCYADKRFPLVKNHKFLAVSELKKCYDKAA
ncbi:MAG: hypothetical protein Q8880_13180 [Bacteroidota bacterium]|nr:hypothetical protein [Bacteroidota bacterium]